MVEQIFTTAKFGEYFGNARMSGAAKEEQDDMIARQFVKGNYFRADYYRLPLRTMVLVHRH